MKNNLTTVAAQRSHAGQALCPRLWPPRRALVGEVDHARSRQLVLVRERFSRARRYAQSLAWCSCVSVSATKEGRRRPQGVGTFGPRRRRPVQKVQWCVRSYSCAGSSESAIEIRPAPLFVCREIQKVAEQWVCVLLRPGQITEALSTQALSFF